MGGGKNRPKGIALAYPSVTQVLRPYQDFSHVPENILHVASDRGSRVHAICATIARGLFVAPKRITPEIEGYVHSFNQWFEYVDGVVLVEKGLVDPKLGFIGHPDLIAKLRGDRHLTLIDLKTPAILIKTWKAQCAAYWHLAEKEFDIRRCGSLRLKKSGSFPAFDEYTYSRHEDFAVFLSALNAWRYFIGG